MSQRNRSFVVRCLFDDGHDYPWVAWLCARLLAILGTAAGVRLAALDFQRHCDALRKINPEELICGLPFLPILAFGITGGAIVGIILGSIVATTITSFVGKNPKTQVSTH